MNQFIYTDSQQCIGCHACEVACVLAHNHDQFALEVELFHPRIWVSKAETKNSAITCRHCEQAPCLQSCPNGAISRVDHSIQVDQRQCIGCKSCEVSCPFGAIEVTAMRLSDGRTKAQAIKCDLCADRPEGPACVENCPTDALHLMTDERLADIAVKRRYASGLRDAHWHQDVKLPQQSQSIALNKPHPTAEKRMDPTKIDMDLRQQSFTELYQTFDSAQAQAQSERCLHCGEVSICQWSCPLHNHIPQWIELVKQGQIIEAAQLIHQTNCMPEITGRICPQDRLCESQCTLKDATGAVTVGNLERYVTESAFSEGWRPTIEPASSDHRVAIVGAGPAGLACAEQLAQRGIKAIVYDRHPEIGGLLTFGIPAFKLDKALLARRHVIFEQMGIEFRLNFSIGEDGSFESLIAEYDAVFVATGTYQPMAVNLPNDQAQGVYDALPYLIANTKQVMGLTEDPLQPYTDLSQQHVVVLGGGDTAMDCVRTAIRQGAEQVTCAYRRNEANMPGSHKEVHNAKEEGGLFEFNVQPIRIVTDEEGLVSGIEMLRTQLGEPDSDGRQRPQPIKGSEFVMPAQAVIIAFGFLPHAMPWLSEAGVELDQRGRIIAHQDQTYRYQTTHPKIFAGGDAVRGADLVVTAMAEGRHAAQSIVDYLGVA